jgi:drug/metabolite transporter (DMT)-like permease
VAAASGAERITTRKVAAVAIAVAGVGTALSGDLAAAPDGAWRGDLVMVGTALAGAVYNVASRRYVRRYPALGWTAYAMTFGALALWGLILVGGAAGQGTGVTPATLDMRAWVLVGYLGVIGAALTFWLWSVGLEHTTPTRVAVTVTLNPVTSMALGAILLGERVTLRLLVGLAAVLVGVGLAARAR